jgi:hypothetical protein
VGSILNYNMKITSIALTLGLTIVTRLVSGFGLPKPAHPVVLGENKPTLREDIKMVPAGIITTFTSEFFAQYSKDILESFVSKMEDLKNGNAGQICD